MQGFWKNFLKISMIFVIFLTVLVLNFTDREKKRFFRFPARIISIPIFAFGEVVYEIKNLWKRYVYLINVEKENENLKIKLLEKDIEINALREKLKILERLKGLLGYRETFQYSTVVGNVIGYSSDGKFKGILINIGKNQGLKEGMPVVSAGGLVGVVKQVYPFSSSVILITDKNLSVDVLNTRTLEKSILTGDGKDGCRLKYYLKTGDVAIGDVFQTARISEFFPRGISVGTVIELQNPDEGLYKEVKIRPFTDHKKLNEVLVIIKK